MLCFAANQRGVKPPVAELTERRADFICAQQLYRISLLTHMEMWRKVTQLTTHNSNYVIPLIQKFLLTQIRSIFLTGLMC